MNHSQLVLSNTATFFGGNIEALFRKARKYGFQYLEVIPYRWNTPQQILNLERKYDLKVVGIHLPPNSWDDSLSKILSTKHGLWEKFFTSVWHFYLGKARISPALKIASALQNLSYVVVHANVMRDMGQEFESLGKRLPLLVENLPYESSYPELFWNPAKLPCPSLFDPGHFLQTLQTKTELHILEVYEQIKPRVIHISYNTHFHHLLPDLREQREFIEMLKIHRPEFVTIETNPLVNPGKGKRLLEKLIAKAG